MHVPLVRHPFRPTSNRVVVSDVVLCQRQRTLQVPHPRTQAFHLLHEVTLFVENNTHLVIVLGQNCVQRRLVLDSQCRLNFTLQYVATSTHFLLLHVFHDARQKRFPFLQLALHRCQFCLQRLNSRRIILFIRFANPLFLKILLKKVSQIHLHQFSKGIAAFPRSRRGSLPLEYFTQLACRVIDVLLQLGVVTAQLADLAIQFGSAPLALHSLGLNLFKIHCVGFFLPFKFHLRRIQHLLVHFELLLNAVLLFFSFQLKDGHSLHHAFILRRQVNHLATKLNKLILSSLVVVSQFFNDSLVIGHAFG
eukprot:m.1589138 g.1589138  ORF g.1589138 m.1589138 type:complete len:307 (+) comp25334_c0_seq3:6410-7330(+)